MRLDRHSLVLVNRPLGHQTMNSAPRGRTGCVTRNPAATLTVIKSHPLSPTLMKLGAPYHYGWLSEFGIYPGLVIFSGRTRRSNSSAETKPSRSASSFSVVPLACAVFATLAALS